MGKIKFLKYFAISASLLFTVSHLPAKSVVQYKNEIENESKNLQQLKKSLEEKRSQKEHAMLEEKLIKKELYRLEQELGKIQKQRETLRKEIKKAEKNLAASEKDLLLAGSEKNQWKNVLSSEANIWFHTYHGFPSLYSNPVTERLCLDALKSKKLLIEGAEQKEVNSISALNRWKAAKEKLINLKAQQEYTAAEREKLKGEKNELLKSTVGKRIAAEEEINKITESARNLEQVIESLEKKRKKTEEEIAARKKFEERKKQLPWPVTGEVVIHFGKNKHAELDTYVISNGIKIRTLPNAEVDAVGAGEVIFTGDFMAYGLMVILDHGGSFYTVYGQLGEIAVEEGQKLKLGDVVGRVNTKGETLLYFEVRSAGKPDDPLKWLKIK